MTQPGCAAPVSGVCRYCGCMQDCVLSTGGGETCGWVDRERTVCNGPRGCLAQYHIDLDRESNAEQRRFLSHVTFGAGGRPRRRKRKAA